MSLLSMRKGERFLVHSAEILQRHGVTLEVGHDFGLYREILRTARPDHELGAPFDPARHRLEADNALWIVGRDRDGEVMHSQALRMLDLGGRNVAQYFTRRFRDFPPSGVALDLPRCRYRAGPGAGRMRGQVAYHGEFWIGGEAGQFRGAGLSCILGRFGFWQAIQHWDPDHVIAFMVKAVAFKGLAERTGWMHTEPGALRWFLAGESKPVEGFMAYMGREDLRYVLNLPLADLMPLAA